MLIQYRSDIRHYRRTNNVLSTAPHLNAQKSNISASQGTFATSEGATGVPNIIVRPRPLDAYRKQVLAARLMVVEGKPQREGFVIHVVADRIMDGTQLLSRLGDTTWAKISWAFNRARMS